MNESTRVDREILYYLGLWHRTGGGFTTSQIGEFVYPELKRQVASQITLLRMRELEKAGLVKRLDNGKPIIWSQTNSPQEDVK